MDRRVRLGLAAQRRLFELVREVAGSDVALAGSLVAKLRDARVLRLDQGAFLEFDDGQARQCMREFLGARTAEFTLHLDFVTPEAEALLRLWEGVDLPMALATEWRGRPEWLEKLLLRGLVREGPRGLRMSMRLRLHLWLAPPRDTRAAWPGSDPVFQVLRELRRQGRWHEAALWASELAESWPGVLERHPSVAVTIPLGMLQSQNIEWLHLWFAELETKGRFGEVFSRQGWNSRMRALRSAVAIERGDPQRPDTLREARIWNALAKCWWHLYAGNYRRVLRTLDFLQRKRALRISWIDTVLASWTGTAWYYLEQYSESRDWNRRAIQLAVESGWQERQWMLKRNLALALYETGEAAEALAIISGLERHHFLYHRTAILHGIYGLRAAIMNIRIRTGSGAWTNRRAQHFALRAGALHHYIHFLDDQAGRARRNAEHSIAEDLYRNIEELSISIGDPIRSSNAVWNRARLTWCLGDTEKALDLLNRAESGFAAMNQHTRAADMKCDRALMLLELNRLDLGADEITGADSVYRSHGWPREAALLEPLRLELALRSGPGAVSEAALNALRDSELDTNTLRAYSYAIVALGFAVLGDDLSARAYGKDTLARVNRLQDSFMVNHLLNLSKALRNHSPSAENLLSFWVGTFPFQAN